MLNRFFVLSLRREIINFKDMNTITIDSNIYQYVANYAAKRRASVKSIVESFILSLNDQTEFDSVAVDRRSSKVLPFNELRPELQNILTLSAPLEGSVPEWDLNGDIARNDSLK